MKVVIRTQMTTLHHQIIIVQLISGEALADKDFVKRLSCFSAQPEMIMLIDSEDSDDCGTSGSDIDLGAEPTVPEHEQQHLINRNHSSKKRMTAFYYSKKMQKNLLDIFYMSLFPKA